MTKKETTEALYLADPEIKRVELIHGDDVEAKKAQGWKEPEGEKANGEAWNDEESLTQRNAAAEQMKLRAKLDAEKEEKRQKEADEAAKVAEKARKDAPPPTPDMKVQIIDPKAK